MKLEASVWSSYFYELTLEEKIKKFIECGFCVSELSTEDGFALLGRGGSGISEFRSFMASSGFSFPQGHLLLKVDICDPSSVDVLKKWLDMYSVLGIRSAVLHAAGGADLSEEERFARQLSSVSALCDYIRGTDITVCLENLGVQNRTSGELMRYINMIKSNNLGICLDTGHLNCCITQDGKRESQRDFILNVGEHLKALHIADNRGDADSHLLPYSGTVNWNEVMTALSDVGYTGLFNFEIPGEAGSRPTDIKVEKLKYIKSVAEIMLSKC